MRYRINRLCGAGAMLAASSLAAQYPKPRVITCYGVASPAAALPRDFSGTAELIVHIGGSLQEDTGADLLAAAVRCLRTLPDPPRMRLVVTGGGESASELERLATEPGLPKVDFLGKVSRAKYLEVLSGAHVGLALKLKLGPLSDTTFPSKVIEITSMGLLLVSTRVSDVPALFGEDGVIYVEDETPAGLAEILQRISNDRLPLREIALRGQRQVQELCSEARVGKALKNFFFDDIQHGSDCRSSGM
jgi:glycosyltransferase involved in cell wall biosynthesis